MKFIHILFFSNILIALSVAITDKTTNTNLRSKKKMANSFKVKIYVDDRKYWNAIFKVADITGNNDDQKRGWQFKLDNKVDEDLLKVLHNLKEDIWFIPFRQMIKYFNFVNPIGQGKWIESTIVYPP